MSGVKIIEAFLAKSPESSGVYQMMGVDRKILYVGKAKNLKKRISSYTNLNKLSGRIRLMVNNVEVVEVITTTTEVEALLLEANLIKKHSPRYNILLRDDKSFPYIYLSSDHEFPMLAKHRGSKARKGNYYGPFASAGDVHKTISILQKTFLLRICADNIFRQRTRPCLEYQIKRCSAPCVNKISKEDYGMLVKQAKDFLSGKSLDIQREFIKQMEAASAIQDYEKAASIRDRIKALTQIQIHQYSIPGVNDADAIGLYIQGNECCVQISFFRGGQYFGTKSYFPIHTEGSEPAEIISAFIAKFYQTNLPPAEIMVSHPVEDRDMLSAALSEIAKAKVEICVPAKGKKAQAIQRICLEAKAALLGKMDEKASHDYILAELVKKFGLDKIPKRIEVFDNSHITGKYQVGAMIAAGPEGFMKNFYRRFNIETVPNSGDDYGMLREVLMRRYGRLKKEAAENPDAALPGLVLIDGGAGHLKVAEQVFADLGIADMPYVCIAKGPKRNAGEETFFMKNKSPFKMEKNDPVLFYLQRLRDEAHRFAIMSHRGKRAKAIEKSALDEIKGIGSVRKKALLNYFGSLKAVEQASINDLAKVPGIEKSTAKIIYDYLHQ